ncbi:MAG TPA: sulfite oxidase [Candidatus Polarisedimenticolaceae bacterium]|nr:sulfite oxidase [Candidatus Polarisedimenticolaceae bacterium]
MTRKAIIDDPYNAETPLDRLDGRIVPVGDFFVRSHFAVPALAPERWRCAVDGVTLDLATLKTLPSRRVTVTLECAGNGRTLLSPPVKGAPWRLGGVATAEFEGVPLCRVLDRGNAGRGAREILFTGADSGAVADGRQITFERSLPIDVARDPDVLVAWGMNGAPLDPHHGAPVRLVVPGWYGVASVKWLVGIRALAAPFAGYFQSENYVYRGSPAFPDGTPIAKARVRSMIASPEEGAVVPAGTIEVRGSAWSGGGPIARVEVSVDGGSTWTDAFLGKPLSVHAATPWNARVAIGPGEAEIRSRATDASGEAQPDSASWNALGYGNNALHRVSVRGKTGTATEIR